MKHDRREHLEHVVGHLAHYLPAQGPIGVFIHHNTLHAFEHLTFEDGVVEAAKVYGTEPYMSEAAYRRDLERGRIQVRDLDLVLSEEPNAPIIEAVDRRTLRKAMLMPGVREFEPETVAWRLAEGDLAVSLRLPPAQNLFEICQRRAADVATVNEPMTNRPVDNVVHPLLIRLCANYLDQGVAYWPMPEREFGFLGAVRRLTAQPLFLAPAGFSGVGERFRRQVSLDAVDVVLTQLVELEVDDFEEFLRGEMLALGGWAGLIYRLQEEPELAPYLHLPVSLMDYLAVRLTLVASAAPEAIAPAVRPIAEALRLARVATLFDALAALNLSAERVGKLPDAEFRLLEREVAACHSLERRRLFHLAYERRHEISILSPIGRHRQDSLRLPPAVESRPTAQVFFCIDEREESTRRHLEEVAPMVRTFGAAGFFGVAMHFTGTDDAHGAPLCPVVMKPAHAVEEEAHRDDEHLLGLRKWRRRIWSRVAHQLYVSSRSLVRGWVSTAVLGTISLFPLMTRVLAPRTAGRLRAKLNDAFFPEPRTALAFERQERVGGDAHHELDLGFTVQEKIDRVGGVLRGAGLVRNFARMVVVLGHGSTSLNNPHESAHDCGACGGRRGGPNGRLFAAMANHPSVRAGLREQVSLDIPEDTWFLGGYHDTCNDVVDIYDLDMLPVTHQGDYQQVRGQLDRARALDAHERSRRFEAFGDSTDANLALIHVEERAEHLAQPRPEYGHCTNAVCYVGRRDSVRGLFLDRRAFLVSYDATVDPDDTFLKRQLGAVILVCSGISLEYYFSFVDNEGYGCGTKLPHNVTGLVGVMNGQSSDLRTGLPWQMVEIHEPVRILFVIETTAERLEATLMSNAYNANLAKNRWIRLATLDPETGKMHVRRNHEYVPYEPEPTPLPVAASSREWYQGKLEHLPIARIERVSAGKI